MFPITVLLAVFMFTAVRQVGRFRFEIWQIMCAGAAAVLLHGDISPAAALRAIDINVMLFLFGMFVVGAALELSGYLAHLEYKVFKRAASQDALLLWVLAGTALASALLMNDTLAVIGTPVMLLLAKKHGMSAKLLLLALAFGITIGSVTSPIGNPQNLLVAIGGDVHAPFLVFLKYLFLPTVVNIFLAFLILKFLYGKGFHKNRLQHSQEPVKDAALARLARFSLLTLIGSILLKIAIVMINPELDLGLVFIAMAAMLPALLSHRRFELIKNADWSTLVFFAAMFILMRSVWDTGFFQNRMAGLDLVSVPVIMGISMGLSQLISNVPMVALFLPMLKHAGAGPAEFMALAAGATIAGNMFILGAASNVIIIQNAEKRSGETLTFLEFARAGVPLALVNALVYWLFIKLV